ncbi:DUF4198 domain-containing protein [Pseudoalteromonas sp. T1lg24]|uniref:DUF4198 domain-containing protein n=1 Tax=Pseudoalteromonas sp. T1lg24 TaxID=2077099 RepID=UPI000CF6967E|nr:DUF4198 domain-containing protein [Pseudoalteromonas sp. T1lg24]
MKSQFVNVTAGLTLALASGLASAHDIYIWPSYFTVNSEKAVDVPVQITASHTTYRPDFAMPSEGVKVFAADGKQVRRIGSFYQGARFSTFDLGVEGEGTYALEYHRGPNYHSRYKIGKRDTEKRIRGNKSHAKANAPKGARDLETASYTTIAMSYVTNKAPTNDVLKAKNKGFEVLPITHPSDYVTGEDLTVSLLFNGKPVANQDVVIELEAPQYSENPKALELKSDEDGLVSFNFAKGGRYMLKVNHKIDSTDPEADVEITRVYYAFEVIFE